MFSVISDERVPVESIGNRYLDFFQQWSAGSALSQVDAFIAATILIFKTVLVLFTEKSSMCFPKLLSDRCRKIDAESYWYHSLGLRSVLFMMYLLVFASVRPSLVYCHFRGAIKALRVSVLVSLRIRAHISRLCLWLVWYCYNCKLSLYILRSFFVHLHALQRGLNLNLKFEFENLKAHWCAIIGIW